MNRLLVVALAAVALAAWSPSTVVVAAEEASISTDDVATESAALGVVEDARISECLADGFDAEALDCRLCRSLAASLAAQLTGSDSDAESAKKSEAERVVTACDRCCTDVEAIDGLAGKHNYARVVLEVCTCKFGRLPKVANFVHNHAAKHSRLEVKYLNARYPHLIFYDEAGEKKEEVSIASWDEDTISEFIEAKLKPLDETTDKDEGQDQPTEAAQQQEEKEVDMEKDGEPSDDVVEVEVAADGE